jgi:hypothetical protein
MLERVCEVCAGINYKGKIEDLKLYINKDGFQFRLCNECACRQYSMLGLADEELKQRAFVVDLNKINFKKVVRKSAAQDNKNEPRK